jgi:hypothetical protein
MTDYWIKISETEEDERTFYNYLITAKDKVEARSLALKFMEHFVDHDTNPDKIEDGFAFCNKATFVRIVDVKETTKKEFSDFLLKTHTIDMS